VLCVQRSRDLCCFIVRDFEITRMCNLSIIIIIIIIIIIRVKIKARGKNACKIDNELKKSGDRSELFC